MSAKKSSAVVFKSVSDLLNPWTVAADYGQQQMAVATESASAICRGLEAMRKVQEQAGQRAMTRHSAILKKIKEASEPAQLMTLQSQLLAADAENASRYWQDLGAAALEMQTEILGCCSHLVDSEAVLRATAAIDHLPFAFTGFQSIFGGTNEHAAA